MSKTTTSGRHAVVDERGLIVNVILCADDFEPGEGLSVVPLTDDSPASPGDTLRRGRLILAPRPPAALTLQQRVAALEAKVLGQ